MDEQKAPAPQVTQPTPAQPRFKLSTRNQRKLEILRQRGLEVRRGI